MRAAGLMLASTLCFGVMAIAIRVSSQSLHTFEVAFFRNLFGLLAVLPLLLGAQRAELRTKQLPKYFVRCLIGICSMLAGFWAIGHLPLAQAISLTYSTPIFVTIAAVLFLHEQVRARRWLAVAAGFIGVLVIVRPGSAEFSIDSLAALLAAVLGGVISIQIKQLSKIDSANTIVLYTYAFWVPMSLLPALFVWQWPHGITWAWIAAAGIFGTGGQVLWTHALKLGEVSALTPISFTQLPLVAIAGWLWFGESLDRYTVIGAAIILGSNAYIAHREAVLARRRASVAATAGAVPGE
ncbi:MULTISPECIES: DMT family transporter [unclassified Lysobacter]|uniref:DMT family transporter n=1 Tax=unclassified Lysobacter TaxID=2635362 RepID=UPI001BEAE0F1|nr:MULTISPECIES: DMT family transporter [unclassified Lysobacter]MBT2747507.1 DMT family transporter [Lysobacter sp. ISL-42]MBT2752330.1 DMT family transporter [Lysobacter sp. ISL-50]MBT2776251.1 DMT family transporter [Lysobacter sp. ISL-54]MBT2784080.1 DMT family transporter [Lysobacter sp. ISL-52]